MTLEGQLHSQSMWEGALFSFTPTGGERVFRLPFLGRSLSGLYNPPSSGLWSPRSGTRQAARLVFSASSRGRGCPTVARCAEPQIPDSPLTLPFSTPALRPRGAGAEKQGLGPSKGSETRELAKRVTQDKDRTRAPGVADPADQELG